MNTLNQNSAVHAALALGSNIGDAEQIFFQAQKLLKDKGFVIEKTASVIMTDPVDCPPGTPRFANSALTGSFAGTPEELLEITQSIEQALGRSTDHGFHTPRTLDIDIIIFGDVVCRSARLTIPHPRAAGRLFVLEPLAEIAPEWIFPDRKKSVETLRQELAGKSCIGK